MTNEIIAFILGSALVVWWSRKSLRAPGSHGFYRFFAWEAILLLFVLNNRPWGMQPLSAHQMISWVLMLISIILVHQGLIALRREGNASDKRGADDFYEFEKTTALVTQGVFKYIRHPMYTSLLALAWGAYFQNPTWIASFVAVLASIFLMLTAKADERECLAYFGEQYADYKAQTWMFIPYLL